MADNAMADKTNNTTDEDRKYHSTTARYDLPNDTSEHHRLDRQAYALSSIMAHRLIHAPINKDKAITVVDVGCGTGAVTKVMAQQYPKADVYGLDLSPVPEGPDRLPNVHYLQGNVLTQAPSDWEASDGSETNLEAGKLDLMFGRLLICGITDWPGYIRRCHEFLRPGGYMEAHDLLWVWYGKDGEAISNDWEWLKALRQAHESKGLSHECGRKAEQWMQEGGFADVQQCSYKLPFGILGWENDEQGKIYGEYAAAHGPAMYHEMLRRTLSEADYSPSQIEALQQDLAQTLKPRHGMYRLFYVTVGRKSV